MAGIRIEGDLTGNTVEVNDNKEIKTALTDDSGLAGFVSLTGESDSGTITGNRRNLSLDVSHDYRVRTGIDTLLFQSNFAGSSLNTKKFQAPVTTMTVAQATGIVTLNSAGITTTTTTAQIKSQASFPIFGTFSTYGEMILNVTQTPQANCLVEWGFGLASGTSAITDGAVFRMAQDGKFGCVVINNSVESTFVDLTTRFNTLVGININHHFIVTIAEDMVDFWIDDVIVATIVRPNGFSLPTQSMSLPVFARVVNTAVPATACKVNISLINVSMGDLNMILPFAHTASMCGDNMAQVQDGVGVGMTQQAANTALPTGAMPTNTTAALGSGLGGIFIAAPNSALTVATDYIVSSYQNPAGTAILPGKNLIIKGVGIDCMSGGVANVGQQTYMVGIAWGHTAVSLATTDSTTTKAPVKRVLGLMSLSDTSPIGRTFSNIPYVEFDTPIIVHPGEFIQVYFKPITYSYTASQTFTFIVNLSGYRL
jgi:hypothetical protein